MLAVGPRLASVVLSALVFACGGPHGSGVKSASVSLTSVLHPLLGQVLVPRTETTLRGTGIRLPLAGKVTVVDFWGTYCKPCLAMLPSLQKLSVDYGTRGVVIVGVAADDNPGLVAEVLRRHGVTYPNVVDDSGNVRGRFRVTDVPATLVFDGTGVLRFVAEAGKTSDADLRQLLESLLEG
jgi:thiol-disulfide isomerase/thioredoxin